MNQKFHLLALTVMENLLKHPITGPFAIPIVPGDTVPEDYVKYVKKPIDLLTIQNNLKNRKYKALREWINAVELVWKNVRTYYDEESYLLPACDESEAIFDNLLRKSLLVYNIEDWWEDITELSNKIQKLNNSPPSVAVFSLSGMKYDEKITSQLYSNKNIRQLLAAMKSIQTTKDHEALIDIVSKMQPELTSDAKEFTVDVYKLHPNTFTACYNYVKSVFERNGLDFPK